MKNKKLLFAVGLVFLATGLFAAGAQEDPLAQYRDQVKLTGTLQFTDGYAEILAGGKAYTLVAPGVQRAARTLKAGLKLAVEGFKVQPGPGVTANRAKSEYVVVQKINIEGKDFDLTKIGPQGRFGRGPGAMMNGEQGWGSGRMQKGQRGLPCQPGQPGNGLNYGGMMGGRGGFEGPEAEAFDDYDFPSFGAEGPQQGISPEQDPKPSYQGRGMMERPW